MKISDGIALCALILWNAGSVITAEYNPLTIGVSRIGESRMESSLFSPFGRPVYLLKSPGI